MRFCNGPWLKPLAQSHDVQSSPSRPRCKDKFKPVLLAQNQTGADTASAGGRTDALDHGAGATFVRALKDQTSLKLRYAAETVSMSLPCEAVSA
jgi:hypothetical protein